MSLDKFTLDRAAVRRLLNSPEVLADLEARAGRIAAAAGPGMEVDSGTGKRARASVRTATFAAMRAEVDTRALTRAIDAGRG